MTRGTVDGLHYELHGGPVAGREVVLLSSGLGGSGAFWAPQMQALTESPTAHREAETAKAHRG